MKRFALAVLLIAFGAPAFATDLTVTAANVKVVDNESTSKRVQYGEAVTQGHAVYKKASDNKWYKADADASAEAAGSEGIAIALTPGSTGEYGYIVTAGNMNVGATLTQGEIYVVSGAAGGICPEADLSSTERVTILGVASSSSVLVVNPFVSSVAIP